MKIREVTRVILTILQNCERGSSRWPLVAAFISGAVLTAAAVSTLAGMNEHTHRENIVPIPQDAPKLFEPGVAPGNNPAEHHLAKLVYAFSEEALISG